MEWYENVFELIDLRSFSNLWYWIGLAVVWSAASHRVLGVPYDMVVRAARHSGQAEIDMEDMVRINVNRLLFITRVSGLWILALSFFIITVLLMLGFIYDVEFCQALLLLLLPMWVVGALSVSTAKLIHTHHLQGAELRRRLTIHRRITQVIGMISIFVTAMWGMWQNMMIGVLGG